MINIGVGTKNNKQSNLILKNFDILFAVHPAYQFQQNDPAMVQNSFHMPHYNACTTSNLIPNTVSLNHNKYTISKKVLLSFHI